MVRAEKTRRQVAPTVVMVHGAWVDRTGWREVIALLQAKGLKVVAVQNPLSSLFANGCRIRRGWSGGAFPATPNGDACSRATSPSCRRTSSCRRRFRNRCSPIRSVRYWL